jgi:hypothetical protein
VLDEGVWTDEDHTEDKVVVEVKVFSAVYFQLVEALPEIGAMLKEFDRTVIAGAAVSLRVTDKGIEDLTDEALKQLVRRFRAEGGTP